MRHYYFLVVCLRHLLLYERHPSYSLTLEAIGYWSNGSSVVAQQYNIVKRVTFRIPFF